MKNVQLENMRWKKEFTVSILNRVKDSYSRVVMSSSFGKHSAAMLHLVTAEIPDIPVVNVKLGTETRTTERHRKELEKRLNLDLHVYEETEDKGKADIFNEALMDIGAETLVSGLMWRETRHREGFEYVMRDRDMDLYRVHPILHWKEKDVVWYLKNHSLPVNADYYDPNKEESEKKECGIHVFDYQTEGSGI